MALVLDGIDPEILEVLVEDEKTALMLAFGHSKSSWQAGEIMEKAHYKYLEIKGRAERFFKLFYNYHNKYGTVLQHSNMVEVEFMDYLHHTVVKRKKPKEAGVLVGGDFQKSTKSRNEAIKRNMIKLAESKRELEVDLYNLVMEFDRWNNFRIMPDEIQEPSAFKRRQKNQDNKQMKIICNLNEFSVSHVMHHYTYEGDLKKYYMPLPSEMFEDYGKIIPIRKKPKIIKKLSSSGFYIFETEEMAKEFLNLIADYYYRDERACVDGQRFWPEFRRLKVKAVNYKDVNNIIPNRKNYEDEIVNASKKSKNRKRKPLKGLDRASDRELGIE